MFSTSCTLFIRNTKVLLPFLVILIFLFVLLQVSFSRLGFDSDSTYDQTTNFNHDQNEDESLGVASKIYAISLPDRADRRQDMEHLRKTLGLRWTYIEAMDTRNVLIEQILDSVRRIRETDTNLFIWPDNLPPLDQHIEPWNPGFLHPRPSGLDPFFLQPLLCATKNNTVRPYQMNAPEFSILSPARVACWYSHLSIIQTIANDNTLKSGDAVIVLEDDIDMERDIRQRLEHVWKFLPPDWDMVYLGHCWSNETFNPALNAHDFAILMNESSVSAAIGQVTYIHPSNSPLCTHAYALSRSGARRLLIHLRYPPFAFSRAIDSAISWLIQSGRLKSYSVVPSVVVQRKIGNSNIMPGKGSAWKDGLVDGVYVENRIYRS